MTSNRETIVARMKDPSPEVRRRAVRELSSAGIANVNEIILNALSDEDWRVRKETILVIWEMDAGADLISSLIDALIQEGNIGLRNGASEALAQSRSDVVTPLLERMESLDPGGRKIALEVIGHTRDDRAVPTLVDYLSNDDPNVRACVAELLGEHPGTRASKALRKCLAGDDDFLSLAALQSLNKMGIRIPWNELEPHSSNTIFGADLLFAMARSGEPAAAGKIASSICTESTVARCLEILHGAGPLAAEAVEMALAGVDDTAMEILARMARSDESSEQRAATRCLMWSRRGEQIPILVSLAGDETLHRTIVDGLRTWGTGALREIEKMLPRVQDRTLASVVGILSRLLDEEAGIEKNALFTAYLNSNNIMVSTAAAGAVARFGDESVVPRLLEMANSEHRRVRRAAGYALTQLGLRHREAVREAIMGTDLEGLRGIELCRVFEVVGFPKDMAHIGSALNSPDPELRRTAPGTLAAVAGSAAVETISLAMTDEDTRVQMAAAEALARIGPAAAETIVSAIHTAEGPLKTALVKALGRVGHIEAPTILRAMAGSSADLAMAALEAMQNLGLDPRELKEDILNHEDAEVVKRALLFLGSDVSAAELGKLLEHAAWDVRLAAVDRLTSADDDDEAITQKLVVRLDLEQDDLVNTSILRALESRKGSR